MTTTGTSRTRHAILFRLPTISLILLWSVPPVIINSQNTTFLKVTISSPFECRWMMMWLICTPSSPHPFEETMHGCEYNRFCQQDSCCLHHVGGACFSFCPLWNSRLIFPWIWEDKHLGSFSSHSGLILRCQWPHSEMSVTSFWDIKHSSTGNDSCSFPFHQPNFMLGTSAKRNLKFLSHCLPCHWLLFPCTWTVLYT